MLLSPSAERWTRRAQVWLGTLVEIALPAGAATDARFAAAFAAITRVHRKMSAHDSASDLARIARDAHRRAIAVDAATHSVLRLAMDLWRESRGAFDVTIAPTLARRGLLPERAAAWGARCGRMHALRLERCSQVRATAPVSLDLGGIAKGHAVDRAVAALRAAGATAGIVNAGGDLRAFGAGMWVPVQVRHPAMADRAVTLFEIRDAAVATSADHFGRGSATLVDPRTHRLRPYPGSITVVAPTCAVADALTKVVALEPARATAILTRYRAHAFRLDAGGDGCMTTCRASTGSLRLAPAA